MRKTAFLGSLAFALLAGAVGAQEKAPPADEPQDPVAQDERAYDEERALQPLHDIRVIENPYDLASYYRSSQSGGFYDYRPEGGAYPDRYPIASYYRQRPSGYGYGYGPFWTNGYSNAYSSGYSNGHYPGRPGFVVTYRQRIGENGDLFLFAPFLSPIGPLTDAFFGN
jgi:hypothetical protein